MEQLSLFEARLAKHFHALGSDRVEGPVFLIEHGLLPAEVAELLRAVGRRGNAVGFKSETWRPYGLSLGVALTEFGYQYRGTGTEFWGFAERGLRAEIAPFERPEITSVFKLLSRDYDIATPLNDRWSDAFGHIAWPIRNALVSREIHSPLATLIRRTLRDKNTFVLNAGFITSIREVASGLSSKRLEAWLSDESLALAVVRALADASARDLQIEQTFMERLDEDLRGNREVRQLSLATRAARRTANCAPKKFPGALYQLLVQDNEPVGLAIRGPVLNTEELAYVSDLTNGESRDAVLSIAGRSITLRNFVSGETIFLGRPRELPAPDLVGISDLNDTIARLVRPSDSLVFLNTGCDGYQPQVPLGSYISDDAHFFELRLAEADPQDWGSAVYSLRANSPEGAVRLSANSIAIAQRQLAEFFGGATLVQLDKELSLVEGHDLWIKAQVGSVELEVKAPDDTVLQSRSLPQSEWVHIDVADKSLSLHLTDGHRREVVELTLRANGGIAPLCLEVSPQDLTLNDIGAGLGSLELRAPTKLDGASVRVSLTDSKGNAVTSEITVETLPAVVSFSADHMSAIREAAQRWSYSGNSAVLVAEVPGLASVTRLLAVRRQDWLFDETDRTWEANDGRRVQSAVFNASSNPMVSNTTAGAEAFEAELLLPDIESDHRLNSGLFFFNKTQISLSEIGPGIVPYVRKNRFSGEKGEGLLAASEALIAWQSAAANNVLLDGIRRRIGHSIEIRIVEALCGNDWLSAEKKLRFVNGGFNRRLVRYALDRKLAAGNDNFDEISGDQVRKLEEHLFVEFKRTLPTISTLVIPDGEEWPALDDAVNLAWNSLANQLKEEDGTEVDGDCIVLGGQWQKAVKDAREADYLRPLARKILPISRSFGLLQYDYSEASFDDLISELNSLHIDVQRIGRHIPPEALRALLSLFLRPSQVVDDSDWRSYIARFASDRFSARAVRYAALRYGGVH
jgi:hypothetical protein